LKTEREEHIGEVLAMDCSTNRARDWSNLITANKLNFRPCFWDLENKSLVKIGIQTYDKYRAGREAFVEELGKRKRSVVKVAISMCGNFGVAGYNDGYLVKVMMQSGNHSKTFFNKKVHQGTEIKGIIIDNLNHFLITADEANVVQWDFYSGIYLKHVNLAMTEIQTLAPDIEGSIFGVVTSSSEVRLLEMHSLSQVRTFKGESAKLNDCTLSLNPRLHSVLRAKNLDEFRRQNAVHLGHLH
jgi:hypothetical protein